MGYTLWLGWNATREEHTCSFNDIVVNYGTRQELTEGLLKTPSQYCGIAPDNVHSYRFFSPEKFEAITACEGPCQQRLQYCMYGVESQEKAWEASRSVFQEALERSPVATIMDPNCTEQVDLHTYADLSGYRTCSKDFTDSIRNTCGLWAASAIFIGLAFFLMLCASSRRISHVGTYLPANERCATVPGICAAFCGCVGLLTTTGTVGLLALMEVQRRQSDCDQYSRSYFDDLSYWSLWALVLLIGLCLCSLGGARIEEEDEDEEDDYDDDETSKLDPQLDREGDGEGGPGATSPRSGQETQEIQAGDGDDKDDSDLPADYHGGPSDGSGRDLELGRLGKGSDLNEELGLPTLNRGMRRGMTTMFKKTGRAPRVQSFTGAMQSFRSGRRHDDDNDDGDREEEKEHREIPLPPGARA